MKYIFIIAMLTPHAAIGQTTDSIKALPEKSNFSLGLSLEFGVSAALTLTPKIRSFFRDNQIKPAPSIPSFLIYGVGFRSGRFRILIHNAIGQKDTRSYFNLPGSGSQSVAQNSIANYTSLWAGYDLINTRNRRLYLNVGFGGMEYGFTVLRRTNQVVPFPTILQTNQPGNVSSLVLRGVGFVDINLEYALREKRKNGIESAVRVGYRTGTFAKAYKSDTYLLTDAPTERISQIYLQSVISLSHNGNRWNKLRIR